MPKTCSLRTRRLPSLGNETLQWVINVPASLSPTGRRQRRFFATRQQAEVECELLKTRKFNFGHSLSTMSPERVAEASACYSRLERECPGITLSHAVDAFIDLHRRRTASVPLRALFDSFLETKTTANRNYQRELRNVFERLAVLNDILVAELDPQQIEQALKGFPDGNRNAALRYLRAAFNYGIRRGWLTENPILRLEFKKRVRDQVEIISPAIVEKLLLDALANNLELLPFLVLAFFCGVRPDGELKKLLWSDVDMGAREHHVTIRAAIAKRAENVGLICQRTRSPGSMNTATAAARWKGRSSL